MLAVPRAHHLDRRAAGLIERSSGEPGDLLNTDELCSWLGMSRVWAEIGRIRGYGPPYLKLGDGPRARIRYRRGDVEEWLRQRTYGSTAEHPPSARPRYAMAGERPRKRPFAGPTWPSGFVRRAP